MMDETRTKCGRNGRNSDLVHECSFITPFKIKVYIRCISSARGKNGYFVHKINGVPFRDINSAEFHFSCFNPKVLILNFFETNNLKWQFGKFLFCILMGGWLKYE